MFMDNFSFHCPLRDSLNALERRLFCFPTATYVSCNYRCRGPGFDSRALQKKVLGLEWGPLSLVSTTEELLDRKVAAPV
jgi:hypothetical protein